MITLIANYKGGSGKSTLAFNFSIWLKAKDENVKVVDLDPQKTLSDVCNIRLEDEVEPVINVESNINDLASYALDNTLNVLVDVGVSDMESMKKAIVLADKIVIPVPPSQPDVWATHRFIKIINEIRGDPKPLIMAFINRADTHKDVRESDEAEEALRTISSIKVLTQRLCQRTIFRRTLSEGMAVFELDKNSKGAAEFEQLSQAVFNSL